MDSPHLSQERWSLKGGGTSRGDSEGGEPDTLVVGHYVQTDVDPYATLLTARGLVEPHY